MATLLILGLIALLVLGFPSASPWDRRVYYLIRGSPLRLPSADVSGN